MAEGMSKLSLKGLSEEARKKVKVERTRLWRLANPEKAAATIYACAQTENHKNWLREHMKLRLRTDPQFRAYHKAVSAVSRILTGVTTGHLHGSIWIDRLGCTPDQFKQHLEDKFLPGMTWENRGRKRGCWQVDHIKSGSEFNLTCQKQLAMFFNYENTQPLWAHENNSKRHYR